MTMVNIYVPKPRVLQQVLMDIKGDIDSNTIIMGGFNIPLSSKDILTRKNVNMETELYTRANWYLQNILFLGCILDPVLTSALNSPWDRLYARPLSKPKQIKTKKLTSYRVSFLTTMKLIWKLIIHKRCKHLETK